MPAGRYFLAMAAGAIGTFLVLWAWIAAMPLAYLDPEYPYWRAKQVLLQRCDLGDLVILGDSRAAVAIRPALMPVRSVNLAVGGGKPVEALAALRQVLACPDRPARVLLSFDLGHFMQPDLFWERSVRFGFLGLAALDELARVSAATADWSVHDARRTDGLPPRVRATLYTARIPPLYFNSLVKAGGFLRWWGNRARLQQGLDARGQYFFGTAAGSDAVALDATLDRFAPAPVLDWYFGALLALLDRHGIEAVFVAMPVNEATGQAIRPDVLTAFHAYLARYAARYPGFHVLGPVVPVWPGRWFGDAFSHLNPAGADRFSHWLAGCLRDWPAAHAGCTGPPAGGQMAATTREGLAAN